MDVGQVAGRIRLAVGSQQTVGGPGRPKGGVDEASRLLRVLLDRRGTATHAGQFVQGPEALRKFALAFSTPDDLLYQPCVLQASGDVAGRQEDHGVGRNHRIVTIPAQREHPDQHVFAMQANESERPDLRPEQRATRCRQHGQECDRTLRDATDPGHRLDPGRF